jgi:hypothetical protein
VGPARSRFASASGGFFTERARSNRADFIGARIEIYSGALDKLW